MKNFLLFFLIFSIQPVLSQDDDSLEELDEIPIESTVEAQTPRNKKGRAFIFKGEGVEVFPSDLVKNVNSIDIFKSKSPYPRTVIRQHSTAACTAAVCAMLLIDKGADPKKIECFDGIKKRKKFKPHAIIIEDFLKAKWKYAESRIYLHDSKNELYKNEQLQIKLKTIKQILDKNSGVAISMRLGKKSKNPNKIYTHAIILDQFTEDYKFAFIRDPWRGVQLKVPMKRLLKKIPHTGVNMIYPVQK